MVPNDGKTAIQDRPESRCCSRSGFLNLAGFEAGGTDTDMPVTTIHPHTYPVQVGQEPALGYIVGVRNICTYLRAFATDFTTAGHKHYSWKKNGVSHPIMRFKISFVS